MTWQDIILGGGQLFFALALLPALASEMKPPRVTCLLTGAALLAFAGTFASLTFWWSASTSLACGGLWLILGMQRRMQTPRLESTLIRRRREEPTELERRELARRLAEVLHRRRKGG